jgi:hypothetical protein
MDPELFNKGNQGEWPTWDEIHLATDRNAVLTPTLSRQSIGTSSLILLTRVDGDSHPGNFYRRKGSNKVG